MSGNMSESSTLKTLLINFKIMKTFGFASFTVENGKSVTKLFDLLYLFVSLSIGATLLVVLVQFRGNFLTTRSEIVDYGNFAANFASILIAIISMILSFIF